MIGTKRLQCKDIPDEPILRFLDGPHVGWYVPGWATWQGGDPLPPNSVLRAMPPGTPEKLARAKMARLIDRGWVDGCSCGCRGDYRLTEPGRDWMEAAAADREDAA